MVYFPNTFRPLRLGARGLLAAACVAGCCRAVWPATAPENDPDTPACTNYNLGSIELSLPNIVLRRIQQIPSAEGHAAAAFLRAHPNMRLMVSFTDKARAARFGRETSPEFMTMSYNSQADGYSINHRYLHIDGGDENTFIRSPKVQQAFTDSIASAFVHETSHARMRKDRPIEPPLIEDELVAYYREVIFLLDAVKAMPNFDRLPECLQDKLNRAKTHAPPAAACTRERRGMLSLLGKLAAANTPFEGAVRKLYPFVFSLDSDPKKEIRVIDERDAKGRKDMAAGLASKDSWEPGTFPADYEAEYQDLFVLDAQIRAFWAVPATLAKTKADYGALLKELRAETDRRRAAGEMKFLLTPAG